MIHGRATEPPTCHNHYKAKRPKAAQAHGHQQSSAKATATGLLSECHGVDVKRKQEAEHWEMDELKRASKLCCASPWLISCYLDALTRYSRQLVYNKRIVHDFIYTNVSKDAEYTHKIRISRRI